MNMKKKVLSRAVHEAVAGICAVCAVVPALASDMHLDCDYLGGVMDNGTCRFFGTTPGTGLDAFGTEWLYLDDDWELNDGNAVIGDGAEAFSTFVYNVSSEGLVRGIRNKGTGLLRIAGGTASHAWGIGHLAIGAESIGTLANSGAGRLIIAGGPVRTRTVLIRLHEMVQKECWRMPKAGDLRFLRAKAPALRASISSPEVQVHWDR